MIRQQLLIFPFTTTAAAAAACLLCSVPTSQAGVSYQDPVGGWRYSYEGAFNPGIGGLPDGYGNTSDQMALDGTWLHSQGDKWDGSAPGEVGPTPSGDAPGGAGRFIDPTDQRDYIRIQDAGNPELHGWEQGALDPINNNRRIYFGHDMTQDGSLSSELVMTSTGITVSFRARIPISGPLDDVYLAIDGDDPDTDPDVIPWFQDSPNGRGRPLTNGRGAINIVQNDPTNVDTQVGFSLITSTDITAFCDVTSGSLCGDGAPVNKPVSGSGGLIMNNLIGNAPSNLIDSESAGELNILEIPDAELNEWNEFWITMENNAGLPGNIEVNVYRNGSLTSETFQVTLASNNNSVYADEDNPFIDFGVSDSAGFGSFDMDFLSYQIGVIAPVAAPIDDADFDNDGDVDGSDFLIWQRGFGSPGNNSQGDANGDNVVDAADLGIWNTNYGSAGALQANSSAIPEPTTATLLVLGALGIAGAKRRRCS